MGGAILVSPRANSLTFSPLLVSDTLEFAFAIREFENHMALAQAALPSQVPFATAVNAAARAAALVRGLSTGSRPLLAVGLNDELHVPHRLPLVPHFERVVQAARSAGAHGATLSGLGSSLVAIAWRSMNVPADAFATGVGLAGLSMVSSSNRPTALPSYISHSRSISPCQ